MKLKDWADKTGIKYLTAYRWFKAGTLPVNAYQTSSGTIIVEDESETMEKPMSNTQSNDVMSIFLKKTVEFSKNNSTIEDFAAFVLTNFTLKPNNSSDVPRYSRNKPKAEDIQNHFKQFIKPKGEKPKPNMFVAPEDVLNDLVSKYDSAESENLKKQLENELENRIDIVKTTGKLSSPEEADHIRNIVNEIHKISNLSEELPNATSSVAPSISSGFVKYGDVSPFGGQTLFVSQAEETFGVGGRCVQNVDVTPQQLNYTSSTNSASDTFLVDTNAVFSDDTVRSISLLHTEPLKSLSLEKPRRGRKSHKIIGNK